MVARIEIRADVVGNDQLQQMNRQVQIMERRLQGSQRSLQRAARSSRQFRGESQRLSREVDNLGRQLNEARSGADGFNTALGTVGRFVGFTALAIGAQQVVSSILRTTDELQRMQNLLRASGIEDLEEGMARVAQIARDTRGDISSVGDLFARLNRASQQFGATQEQVAAATTAVAQGLRLGGAGAQEAAAATLQLGQALASGRLQGDELRSILESAPVLAQALAEELGYTVGELREAGAEGRLVATDVFDALVASSARLNAEAADLPDTIGQAFTVLSNSVSQAAFDIGSATSETIGLQGALVSLGGIIDDLFDNRPLEELRDGLEDVGRVAAQAFRIDPSGFGLANDQLQGLVDQLQNLEGIDTTAGIDLAVDAINQLISEEEDLITQGARWLGINHDALATLEAQRDTLLASREELAEQEALIRAGERAKVGQQRAEQAIAMLNAQGTAELTKAEQIEQNRVKAVEAYRASVEGASIAQSVIEDTVNRINEASQRAVMFAEAEATARREAAAAQAESLREGALQNAELAQIQAELRGNALSDEEELALLIRQRTIQESQYVDRLVAANVPRERAVELAKELFDTQEAQRLQEEALSEADRDRLATRLENFELRTRELELDREGVTLLQQHTAALELLEEQRIQALEDAEGDLELQNMINEAYDRRLETVMEIQEQQSNMSAQQAQLKLLQTQAGAYTNLANNAAGFFEALDEGSSAAFFLQKAVAVGNVLVQRAQGAAAAATAGAVATAASGGNPAVGAAVTAQLEAVNNIATGFALATIAAQTLQGRRFGGPVAGGTAYRVGEGGAPEIYSSGGRNYLIPGDDGFVTSNRDAFGGSEETIYENVVIQANVGFGPNSQATADAVGTNVLDQLQRAQIDRTGRSPTPRRRRV